MRIYNPQEKKLDPTTISEYLIGYAKRSKGYRFYYPSHSTTIVESRNAKFLENDLISGIDKFRGILSSDIVSNKDHYEVQPSSSNYRLIYINTPQVQMGIRQLIAEVPQPAEIDPIDQVLNEKQKDIVEQPVE